MARGGARLGAGRKKGSLTAKTRVVAEKAAATGLTPLEVMVKAMRRHAKANRWDEAASIAKDAAPYMHPKLSAVAHTGPNGGPISTVDLTNVTDDQLTALETLFGPLAGSGDDDAGDPSGDGSQAG